MNLFAWLTARLRPKAPSPTALEKRAARVERKSTAALNEAHKAADLWWGDVRRGDRVISPQQRVGVKRGG